jgi:hypothetical protein
MARANASRTRDRGGARLRCRQPSRCWRRGAHARTYDYLPRPSPATNRGGKARIRCLRPSTSCEIRPRAAQLRPVTGRLHVYPARVIGQSRRNRMNPDLSVILPCYRSAPLAAASVVRLAAYLRGTGLSSEIIVVDEGGATLPSSRGIPPSARASSGNRPTAVRGAAVASGMRSRTGQCQGVH